MLRRAADNAYWLGRYVERAEALARMADVHFHARLEGSEDGGGWETILAIAGMDDDFRERHEVANEGNVLEYLAFDGGNPSSVMSCLRAARENARSLRGGISGEMWEAINRWYLDLREWDLARMERQSAFDFFRRVKEGSHLFHGAALRTQAAGEAREFLKLGGFIEQADATARILDVHHHSPSEGHGWGVVLQSVGAYEAYLKRYRHGVRPESVIEFLVLNPSFPASILFSISRAEISLRAISGNLAPLPANDAEREAGKLTRDLMYLTVAEIHDRGMHDFLEGVQERCADLGNAVWETYLSY